MTDHHKFNQVVMKKKIVIPDVISSLEQINTELGN